MYVANKINPFLLMKYLIIAAIVIIVRIIIFLYRKNRNQPRVTILGREIAAGDEKEKQRIVTGNFKESPLHGLSYRNWKDEQSLINPVKNELDLTIINLCKKFINGDESIRTEIRNSLSQEDIYTLIEFIKRATVFAIRNKETGYINNGFTAVSMIETERCDFRDVWVVLSFLNYGLKKFNADNKEIYEETMQRAEQKTAGLIKNFFERALKSKNVKGPDGYMEVQTPYGSGFVHTYLKKYSPKKDIVKMLFEISDYLSKDKYENGEIVVGSDIDAIWFGARNDKNIERLNAKANGCAFIRATLKESLDVNNGEQDLYVYLTEFNDLDILNILKGKAESNTSSSFAWLCFSEDNLLCMVIQRSVRHGVKDYETNESLKRLEDGLREIIAANTHSS
jgi:hypothetical protein